MSGCKADRAYAVVRDNRLLRLSFSKSLCDHIVTKVPGAAVRACRVVVGRALAPGAVSVSGLYAVVKAKSGWPLRVTLFPELAESWRHETRRVHECWLTD